MRVLTLSQIAFDNYLKLRKITPDNVEQQDKILFISINNNYRSTPYFPQDKKNVKVMFFDDVIQDIIVSSSTPVPGTNKFGFTEDDAILLYTFLMDNMSGKEVILIHCDETLRRSNAVARFIVEKVLGGFGVSYPIYNTHVFELLDKLHTT